MNEIQKLKSESGAAFFASFLGKSSLVKASAEYQMVQEVTQYLVAEENIGVIHGGYKGGTMAAVSDAANKVIQEKGISRAYNIGVPQAQHDGLWKRVPDAIFTEAAQDIQDRLRVILSGEIVVVGPLGGDGTHLETAMVFHENVIREERATKGQNTEKTQPLIFLLTLAGTNWKELWSATISLLAHDRQTINDYEWLYFVSSLNEFQTVMATLRQGLSQNSLY